VEDIYEIPIVFEKEGLPEIIHKKLNIYSPPDLRRWKKLIDTIRNPKSEISIAVCGKYTKLEDSYASIIESLNHCSAHLGCRIELRWIETTGLADARALDGVNGVIVPGGFGSRGTEGKIEIIRRAREEHIPFLGLCLGLQLAVVEFARNACGLTGAHSTEFDPDTPYPVIDLLPEQKHITEKGGTMRLGAYEAVLNKGSLVRKLYGTACISERHRHRYEVNPEYHTVLTDSGLVLSGTSKDGRLVEFIELPTHDFFVATQAHPELKSRMEKPSPLFYGFIQACMRSR
jgi:CTP synthase